MTRVTQPPSDEPPQGWAQPGWTQPGPAQPGPAQPGPTPAGPAPQWGAPPPAPAWGAPAPGWAPVAKPGIVPLRPLGVGELLDGAIGAVRTNPRTVLGLSAVVVVATSLLQFVATWLVEGDIAAAGRVADESADLSELVAVLGDTVSVVVLAYVATWIATTLLGGLLAVAVGRAVIGESPTPGQAWAAVRPVALRLLGTTIVVGLLVAAPLLAVGLVAVLLGTAGAGGDVIAGLVALGLLVAVPVSVWLYVRFALFGPVLVLESGAGTRRVSGSAALRRSAALVQGAWWRTFGLLLLVWVIAAVASTAIGFPFGIVSALVQGGDPDPSALALAIGSFGGMIGALLTTPFTAAAVTLLYVDRRIRREGLDIELARAAGVTIPGRTDVAGGQAPGAPPPAP